MLRRVIGEDVEFELELDRGPLPVEVDPVQIDQVLMYIVVNARDAMPCGGRLKITTATALVGDPQLPQELGLDRAALVTVADTGCGMDAATQDRIFEPFFSTKEPAKGSGLGLATANDIVRRAGGSITVSSRPGEGTTFRIYLPLAAADVLPVEESEAGSTRPAGGPETVLVVEDEPALRELERLMLEEAGYDVLTAADASEALVVAAEEPVDVLVVDVVMPGMSGPELVQELAARGIDAPAVFVSGYGADEISSRGVPTAEYTIIEKPFHADVLLANVRDVLDRANPQRRPMPRRFVS
jgi:CheY-like chemotaxis protein